MALVRAPVFVEPAAHSTSGRAGQCAFFSACEWNASRGAHLQSAFGSAAGGGVRYYTLDNEVML